MNTRVEKIVVPASFISPLLIVPYCCYRFATLPDLLAAHPLASHWEAVPPAILQGVVLLFVAAILLGAAFTIIFGDSGFDDMSAAAPVLACLLTAVVSLVVYQSSRPDGADNIKSTILAATTGGRTPTAVTAYDLTAQCLSQGGFFESGASQAARCQAQSLDFIAKGSFPATEKAAASHVVTELIAHSIREDQGSKE